MATRGRSFGTVERLAQKAVTTAHRLAYEFSGGRLGSTLVGSPVSILTTTGRNPSAAVRVAGVEYPVSAEVMTAAEKVAA